MAKSTYGGPYNRRAGESYDSHNARCYHNHQADWQRAKQSRGEWVPKKEYEKRTGRPGLSGLLRSWW